MVNMVKPMLGYEKKIFAFIDILGFEKLIEMSKRQPALVSEIHGLLSVAKRMAQNIVGRKLKKSNVDLDKFVFHMFSDTVTISCPYESHDYFNITCATIVSYQYMLWSERGIFIRGGVAYGDIYEESDMVFGPVVIDAYRLEKRKAFWPRVLVDQSILSQLSSEEKERDFAEHLRKDDSGVIYLDYLRDLFNLAPISVAGKQGRAFNQHPIEILKLHKSRIEDAMKDVARERIAKRRKLQEKYECLADYHDCVVDHEVSAVSTLLQDQGLACRISSELMEYTEFELEHGFRNPKQAVYTANNLDYVDVLPVLGIAQSMILAEHKDLDKPDIKPEVVLQVLLSELPKYLTLLSEILTLLKINRKVV